MKYAGTPFVNTNAIMFYALSVGLIVFTWPKIVQYPERLPAVVIPIAVLYLGFGSFLYYFLVSDKYIVIKNAFWFWKNRVYALDEVEDIAFEEFRTRRVRCNALRVTTKDFRNKVYPAAGLWGKHWKKLKAHFEAKGVNVRDYLGM